ncbi:MAG: NAD(P)/FAD-dependent oxidoreductase [Lachnospiraceae bacterium]|nr:NAD(P)/FAD-dependent oxidoreductase [Lachnospiraceae bacterium]
MDKSNVIVIGGGASGMMAAITAAREGSKVTILERMDRVGKKILSTGNGKCNYTNRNQDIANYHGADPAFISNILDQFDSFQTMRFFDRLGIMAKDKNGYIYPNSGQASSILDVLRMEIFACNINVECGVKVTAVEKKNQTFIVHTFLKDYEADSLIIACGSKAAPSTGSDGSGYEYVKAFGHKIIPVLPALVQLKSDQKFFKSIAGVRCDAHVSLFTDNNPVASDTGELQITDYGISGIPVFQVSRYASIALNEHKKVTVFIDFFPDLDHESLIKLLVNRFNINKTKSVSDAMIGMINKKLITLFIREAAINPEISAGKLTEKEIERLAGVMDNFKVNIVATNSFENAQVCCGGVDTEEINPYTMESKLLRGLFFAGEIVDVDGACGGYNLQWAWSSGYVAGKNASLKKPVFSL